MISREEFRCYAVGVFYYQNRKDSVDFAKLEAFVEGSIMAYDYIQKLHKKQTTTEVKNELLISTDDDIIATHGVSDYATDAIAYSTSHTHS